MVERKTVSTADSQQGTNSGGTLKNRKGRRAHELKHTTSSVEHGEGSYVQSNNHQKHAEKAI